jgi:hypothetical protein
VLTLGNKHGHHRQLLVNFKIIFSVKKKITCLNKDICIQNAVISIQIFSSPDPKGQVSYSHFLPSFGSFGQAVFLAMLVGARHHRTQF